MTPFEANTAELQRLRRDIADGVPIDIQKEIELANVDDAIAEAFYTQQAVDRVNQADTELERAVSGQQ